MGTLYLPNSVIPVRFYAPGYGTGDTVRMTLQKSDGQYWTGTGQTFQVALAYVTLTHIAGSLFGISFDTDGLGQQVFVAVCEQTTAIKEYETTYGIPTPSGAVIPYVEGAVTMSDAIDMVRARIGESTEAFWLDDVAEIIAWINDGIVEQHKLVAQKWEAAGKVLGHPFLQYYTRKVSTATSAGVQDYAVPVDCSRMIQVNYNGYKAMQVMFAQDYAVKHYPQYGPTPEDPKYSFADESKLRLYVDPGSVTVPISTVPWDMTFMRKVVIQTSTAGTVDCLREYMAAPVDYACAKCLEKNRDDATPFWTEFKMEVESIA